MKNSERQLNTREDKMIQTRMKKMRSHTHCFVLLDVFDGLTCRGAYTHGGGLSAQNYGIGACRVMLYSLLSKQLCCLHLCLRS